MPELPTYKPSTGGATLSGGKVTKQSNPKDALASGKTPFHLIPPSVTAEVAAALSEGAAKYGAWNWTSEGVRFTVYYSAALRHLGAWLEGEDLDPDSGISHVTKAIAGLVVLRDSMIRGNAVDDRPPKTGGGISAANDLTLAVRQRYPSPKPPVTELSLSCPEPELS